MIIARLPLGIGVGPRADRPPPPRACTGTARPAARPRERERTGAVRPDELPADVRERLWRHLDTLEKLDVLQYARVAELPWTTSEVALGLRLPEPDVAVATAALCQAGLLTREGYTYHRTPSASYLGAAVDVIQRACAFEPLQVLRMIEALANEGAPVRPVTRS